MNFINDVTKLINSHPNDTVAQLIIKVGELIDQTYPDMDDRFDEFLNAYHQSEGLFEQLEDDPNTFDKASIDLLNQYDGDTYFTIDGQHLNLVTPQSFLNDLKTEQSNYMATLKTELLSLYKYNPKAQLQDLTFGMSALIERHYPELQNQWQDFLHQYVDFAHPNIPKLLDDIQTHF